MTSLCTVSIFSVKMAYAATGFHSASPDFDRALSHALEVLGCSDFDLKKQQRQAIQAVYQGKDVFMWLPTGFGKSICFQALPFVFDYKLGLVESVKRSIVLVVAPLVALMVDQVQSLQDKDVKAAIPTSGGREGTVPPALLATEETLGSASLLFCSPEALVQNKWRDVLDNASVSERVCAVVVDEAHCVSKWYVLSGNAFVVVFLGR